MTGAAETTMRMSRVGAFDVRSWDRGSGPPLLYLHGFEQHPGEAPYLARLAERHSVKAPEHPGFGASTGIEDIQHILDVALHYREMVEAWGQGPVDVVGHALGGMFAAEFAAVSPHLVRRLVLVSPYGVWRDDEPAADPFVLPPAAMDAAKWHDAAWAKRETSAFTDVEDKAELAIFRTKNLSAATKFLWPIPDRGLNRRLRHIKAPTLVIRGESDGLVPLSYARDVAAGIAGARFEAIPAAGHLPMVETEQAFIDLVEDFLR